ncbi:MAG: SMI1/KNR4 family protein [Gemmataceae bacterium]
MEYPVRTVHQSWAVIHTWLDHNAPAVRRALNAPADEATLSDLERAVGRELPEAFRASYLIHDGAAPVSGPIGGVPLLTAAGVTNEWKSLKKQSPDLPPPSKPVSARPGAIREVGWSAGWVPFAGPDEQNYIALDFDPGPTGAPGQVITFGADQYIYKTPRYVLAPSFGAFMNLLAELFASGEVEPVPEEPATYLRLARRNTNGALCGLLNGAHLLVSP